MKILVIEDDKSTLMLIRELLDEENYIILETTSGVEGLEIARKENPDILILDINLPDKNGLELCSEIRAHPELYQNPYIFMLTVEKEKLRAGFLRGADDYIKKPFDYDEFSFKIKAVSKRITKIYDKVYKYGDIVVDNHHMVVYENSIQINLTKKEIDLLILLILNKGILMPREVLLESVWGIESSAGNRTVDVAIHRLKDKLPTISEKIQSVRGIGYKLDIK